MTTIRAVPISARAFAPFGDLLAPRDAPTRLINAGRCERHHALATVERGGGARGVAAGVVHAGIVRAEQPGKSGQVQHQLAAFGRHAGAKAVGLGPLAGVGLVGTLHG